MKRSLWAVALLILVAAESAHAQTPCNWTPQTGSVVETCGSVGIGTTTPSTLFHVAGTTGQWAIFQRGTKRLYVNANWSDNNLWSQLANRDTDNMGLSLSSKDNNPEYLFVATNGNIGIGTTAPADKLHIFNGTTSGAVVITTPLASSFPANSVIGGLRLAWKYAGSASNNVDLQVVRGSDAVDGAGLAIFTSPSNTQTLERVRVTSAGRVGIGTTAPTEQLHVVGNIHVTGNINAKYQDVAEWVPASSDLSAGTVVVLNPVRDNEVMASGRAYDTSVAGVVSAQPGIILGEAGASKEQVATTGRVRVKVDASHGAIAVGDLLVTSGKPGYAMRSEPMEINGRSFHQPGTIIGKALEPFNKGEGEILVLLSLQ